MSSVFVLRDHPELKFILDANQVKILDVSDPTSSGSYLYSEIRSITLNEKETNWMFSIFSMLIEIWTGLGNGKIYETNANLTLITDDQKIKIGLQGADLKQVNKTIEFINEKTHLDSKLITK
ncbi:hypothetical protein I5168_09480 [Nonlabens sp. SCSIO 43208]|uniref:hypothetical protein n=1 Tax=Nonlabens sp. SCSIO 43208 TaxID=2793009 RepID=UPI003D6BE6B9